MGSIPLPALQIRPVSGTDFTQQLGQTVALRNALQQNAFERQMQPMRLQQEQQAMQMQQMQMQNMQQQQASTQAMQKAWVDGQGDMQETSRLAAQYGAIPKDIMAYQQGEMAKQKTFNEMEKTKLENLQTQGAAMQDIIQPILKMDDPQKQVQAANAALQMIQQDPNRETKFGPIPESMFQQPITNVDQIKSFASGLLGRDKYIGNALKEQELRTSAVAEQKGLAELPTIRAKAELEQAGLASWEKYQAANPNKTYDDYLNAKQAKTIATEEAIRQPNRIAIADINRRAQVEGALAQGGIKQITEMFADPQKGISGQMAQIEAAKALVQAGADGNQVAAQMAPILTAAGISVTPGQRRINPAAITAAKGTEGSVLRRLDENWSQMSKGKISADQAKDLNDTLDQLATVRQKNAVRQAQVIAANMNVDPKQIQVLDKSGGIVSLDDAAKGKGVAPSANAQAFISKFNQ